MARILKKPFAIVLAIIILSLTFLFMFLFFNSSPIKLDDSNIATGNGKTVSLLNDQLTDAIKNYSKNSIKEKFSGGDMFHPKAVAFNWKNYSNAESYSFKISLNKDFSNAIEYSVKENKIVIEDLFSGKTYYCKLIVNYSNKVKETGVFKFKTANNPRTISINGISNTRDIGGYYTEDGAYRIKQGIVYRGANLDELSITAKEDLLNKYNVKTIMDLRGNLKNSPVGDNVNFICVDAPLYTIKALSDEKKIALITEIRAFADQNNFPMYVHCQIGRDRTGTICFLISALLGVSELDLCKDFQMSFFSSAGNLDGASFSVVMANYSSLYMKIRNYSNGNLKENAEKFMLDLGITAQEISNIRNNLLEKV